MLINLRNALMAGKKRVTFIEWLQSDGTGYVDLQYAPTDPETRMLITASTSTEASNYAPLVCAGMNTAMNDVTKPAFGFASINNDRQIYLRCTRQNWWNKTANAGNWNDGDFHVIDIAQTGTRTCSAYLDGQSIETQRISNSTSASMPTDSQTVFASKYNGEYYLKNSKFKVARIAYEVGGVIAHDFVAAKVGETCGFYDITTSKFIAGVGGLVAGPEIHAVEYIESHGTEYIDTGFKASNSTRVAVDFELTSSTVNRWILGARNGASSATDKFALFCGNNSSYAMIGSALGEFSSVTIKTGRHLLNMSLAGGVVVDSQIVATYSASEQAEIFSAAYAMVLFNLWNGSLNSPFIGKYYVCDFWDNGDPVRKFRPVRVGTDATSWEGAMMDVLTRRIYRNAGTGAFAYGNDLKYPIPAE